MTCRPLVLRWGFSPTSTRSGRCVIRYFVCPSVTSRHRSTETGLRNRSFDENGTSRIHRAAVRKLCSLLENSCHQSTDRIPAESGVDDKRSEDCRWIPLPGERSNIQHIAPISRRKSVFNVPMTVYWPRNDQWPGRRGCYLNCYPKRKPPCDFQHSTEFETR